MTQGKAFKGRQVTAEVILWAVRWYLMFPIGYRDLELMLQDRGVAVDHTTLFRWIQAYAPELEKRIRPHLRACNGSWRVDETYVKVKGRWTYLYRAVDSRGQTIDFLLSAKRDAAAAKRFFRKAPHHPSEVLAPWKLDVIGRPPPLIWRSLGDGWDRNGSGGGSGRPCRTASFAKQEAARGAGVAGGDGVGRPQRQPDGTGRRRAARGRAVGHALPMDQPAARQRAHRCRSRDGALRARGSGTRLRQLSNPRGDHRPEQGQRRPSHGDGVAARGRACPAFGVAREEDPRRHRLSRTARGLGDGCRPAARGGAPHPDGRSFLWLARVDRLVSRSRLGAGGARATRPAPC